MFDLRLDGDVLIYRAGFAADANSDELSHSLYNVKAIIKTLKLRFPGKCTIVLSSSDPKVNWRSALTDDYKVNRILSKCCDKHVTRTGDILTCKECTKVCKGYSVKPKHFKEIKDFLIKRFDAKVVPWGEADDWLGVNINPNGDTTVIASIDKDLLMLPGMHYRMQSNKVVKSQDPGQLWLSESKTNRKILGTGLMWFFAQLLLGDAVDNIISPAKGFGPVKVYKKLIELKEPGKIFKFIREVYSDDTKLQLNAKLLWIAREKRQEWTWELMEKLCQE